MEIGSYYVSLTAIPIVLVISVLSWLFARFVRSSKAFFFASGFPGLLGMALALSATHDTGYVAAYSFGAAWFLAAAFVISGLPMLPFHVLRRGGQIAVITGVSFLAGFYLIIVPATLLHLTSWAH